MNEILQTLEEFGFFPIVEIHDIDTVRPLVRTLVDAGLPVIEIPIRTDAALDAMKIIRDEFPEVLLGAGTILSPADAKQAHEAGARFMLAPGLNPRVADYCLANGHTFIPGIHSPSEIDGALAKGLDAVKFFPAEESGGMRYLRAIAAPFKNIRFMPTGGINNTNIGEYLGYKRVLSCGGTWIAKAKHIAEGKFDEIEKLVRTAIEASHCFEIERIETAGSDESQSKALGEVFPFFKTANIRWNGISSASNETNARDSGIEPVTTIVVSTINLKRAVAYLKRKGVSVLTEKDFHNRAGEFEAIFLQPRGSNFQYKIIEKSAST
jgi:2-dehydro-3-deoxyphosphogluconate aldolase/(4S)-4-hydroxy-2-oxoglutarate aldolase